MGGNKRRDGGSDDVREGACGSGGWDGGLREGVEEGNERGRDRTWQAWSEEERGGRMRTEEEGREQQSEGEERGRGSKGGRDISKEVP